MGKQRPQLNVSFSDNEALLLPSISIQLTHLGEFLRRNLGLTKRAVCLFRNKTQVQQFGFIHLVGVAAGRPERLHNGLRLLQDLLLAQSAFAEFSLHTFHHLEKENELCLGVKKWKVKRNCDFLQSVVPLLIVTDCRCGQDIYPLIFYTQNIKFEVKVIPSFKSSYT